MQSLKSSIVAAASLALVSAALTAAVLPAPAAAQQQTISQRFLANPGQVLSQYPEGGTAMVSLLREVAIADPGSLNAILGLVPNASKAQKTAIGNALGQAAKVVVKTNQAYANQILQAIAETKDQDVFVAYSGGANDQGTAATGGGGAGAGGAVGGQTNTLGGTPTSTGSAQAIGGGSTPTGNFTYNPSTTGTGSTTGTSTTTTFTISTTTSP
ncbi:hypothetical protein ACQR1I_20440 [Bradyrhizobium sp. HKCCYLS2038]|uniref:hypothetical protein n=1 Tax=unclassified Bradyrhizobium TaxID=2631580 RepID=UPI003EBD79D2